nr:hypothetical protein [Tanacetum cinerariifolium]
PPNPPKPFVKFVKPKNNQPESKTKEQETPKKPQVKYVEQYRHSNKRPKGNQRNWNNMKSYQLGPEFVLHKKSCFNYGDFSHLANNCRRRVQRETTRSQNHTYRSPSHRSGGHRPHGGSMRPSNRHAGHRSHGPSMNPIRPNMNDARPNRSVFIQASSYETRPFYKSAVKTPYRALWVPTVNRNTPPVNRKFSTSRRNFPTVNRKFPTASRKFTTGSTKNHTADMGRKGKANEHYALWEVIEFGDSYEAPQEESSTGSESESFAKKKGRTVAITTEDMQKRRNDVKARTTLLLALSDEHQLRFIKYKTAQELNRGDLDTMSLDDVYNHLKVYEPEVQNKSESNYQNMAFISSAKNSSRKGEVNTACILTASTQVSSASADVAAASISHDTIEKDDIEEMDIKWNMALLSMWADKFWKKTGKKITIQGWDWSYMANEEKNHALVADDKAPTEFTLMAKSSSWSKNEEVKELIRTRTVLDTVLFPPPTQVYSPPKKDMSWTGLHEFVDDPITDYSRPSSSIESKTNDLQNSNFSVSEHGESSESILSKPMIKFVKAADSPTVIKTNKVETVRKPSVKYAKMYRNTSKSPKGNSHNNIDDKGYWDSGFSRHMTGNISYLSDYEPYDGGYVSFGQGGGKITGKGRDFKLKDDTNVLLRTPRQHNMFSIDLNNIIPHKDLTCLVAKAAADESMLWHKRLGHLNFKIMNKLVWHNLGKGLPSKCFENDHTYVACLKGKQHKASCKTKCDNGSEFKNSKMNEFYTRKGIQKEFSNARTPQQNRVAERRNKTLIEAARTMLADAKFPVTFWAEAVNTACYVQNRVLGSLMQKGMKDILLDTLLVVAGTSSTNFSSTKDAASQDVKKDVSSLRYIALPN